MIGATIATVGATLIAAGCGHTVLQGRAVSMLYDPDRVAGLPVTDGPNGPRSSAPPATGTVSNTNGGTMDRLALLAINDIEDFWKQHYSDSLHGAFTPVATLLSYNSGNPLSPWACGNPTYHLVNAFYCHSQDLLAWDRGTLLPLAAKFFGDMAINGLLAHEYGHAVQWMASLVDEGTPTLAREQQADCFAGVYLRWVAAGNSPRSTLNTSGGLNHVLAGLVTVRDHSPGGAASTGETHGTALDRIGAFQIGFGRGAGGCATIDMAEIQQRRGDLPTSLFHPEGSPQSGNVAVDSDTMSTLMEVLGQIFAPANPPTLSTDQASCSTGSQPAAYCPDNNTIAVDLPALQQIGAPADASELVLLQGDNTAVSIVTSRYMLALQHQRGLPLDSPMTAMRTACLTGVAQRKMAEPVPLPSGKQLVLSAGDLDEAVAGLLTNGLVASDVNGKVVPAGFTRVFAFRSGLHSNADQCYQRFSWQP